MGSLSPLHWMVVIAIAVLLFGGRGKISGLMGDFAKGIKAFKSGMKEEGEPVTPPAAQVAPPAGAAPTATVQERPREHV
jgi:sec-independent protein translocase protein TatA